MRVRRRQVAAAVLVCGAMVVATACSAKSEPETPGAGPSSSQTPSGIPSGTATAPTGPLAPLTGLPLSDASAATRPTVTFKIDNIAAARPQAGLNSADLVIETLVEGGLTRLFTVFQSTDAPMVGPIRSARPVDTSLLIMLSGGIFAFSGAVPKEIADLKANSGAAIFYSDSMPKYFTIRKDRRSGHDVFTSTSRLYEAGLAAKPGLKAPKGVFTFGATAPAGTPTTSMSVKFPAISSAWTWNGTQYLRTQQGTDDLLEDGSQVNAANVVVLSVGTAATDGVDRAGSSVPLPIVTGSGTCWVLRDGIRVEGTWSRPKADQPWVLKDTSGQVIPLHPGRTWVELLPTSQPAPTFG